MYGNTEIVWEDEENLKHDPSKEKKSTTWNENGKYILF